MLRRFAQEFCDIQVLFQSYCVMYFVRGQSNIVHFYYCAFSASYRLDIEISSGFQGKDIIASKALLASAGSPSAGSRDPSLHSPSEKRLLPRQINR